MNNLYEERKKQLLLSVNLNEVQQIPVVSNIYTLPLSRENVKYYDALQNEDLYVNTFKKTFKEIYSDCAYSVGPGSPHILALEALGCDTFRISPDGVTVQHKDDPKLEAEEYDQLIENPNDFIINVLAPRKMKNLNGTKEEVRKALIKAMEGIDKFTSMNARLGKEVQEETGIVALKGGTNLACPFDAIFDRLRGFRNTMVDVRRYPEKVLAAAEALAPNNAKPLENIKAEFPFSLSVPHAPTFLGTKNFEKFYWPWYGKNMQTIAEKGSKSFIVLEGKWIDKFDMLYDMPKASVIGLIEEDEIFELKKKYGDKIAFAGGSILQMMKYEDKQVCFDYAKKVIDECAYGGGLLFSSDKIVMRSDDVNMQTYIELQEFVHEYIR